MDLKATENDGGDLRRPSGRRRWPLWARIALGALVGVIAAPLLPVLYIVWFVTGKPHVTVDYMAIVDQMSQSSIPDADNAWSYYEKAFDAYTDPDDEVRRLMDAAREGFRAHPPVKALTAEQERGIRDWVQDNEEAWQLVLAGSQRRHFRPPYEIVPADHSGRPWLWQVGATGLPMMRHFVGLGVWRSRLAVSQRKLLAALQDCLTLMRAGVPWQQRPSLIEQLVGSRLSSLGHEQVLHILADPSLSAADLSWLQEELAEVYAGGFMLTHLEGDRLCLLDTVQHVFTEGGPGGGHLIPRELACLSEMIPGDLSYWGPQSKGWLQYVTLSMGHVRRDEFLAKANEIYDRAERLTQTTPYQYRHMGTNTLERALRRLDKRKYSLIWWILPAVERVSTVTFGRKALHDGTVLALALRRWHVEKGSYPPELGMLVEGQYIGELPLDPFSDAPPVYRRTDDGFLLYSLGPNFVDDGGRPGLDRTGRARLSAGDGDIVFWPPAYVP